ncbi:PREDICTED: ubiquitin carboxyl-terminal hydrolase 19 [Tarenaya hassleriana]|uniref:ubiquitin carboxyl-terminal hydrolase 19 n=1 Tax=Tarenaya hassleriana TaxID=28532 RepID=UPI00053C86EF|nr:PREDICTED: ubiquitin carboxyl-terminal hydrolase 19 [Tarenaya hassleriana]XP_010525923.1 PREDICTED: ubiquitin carboxyl-terminal hydrolase 19 [Tarenaya hassleriana]
MHEVGLPVDLNLFTQLVLTLFFISIGVVYLIRTSAAKYFEVDGGGGSGGFGRDYRREFMASDAAECAVCGEVSSKKCSRCKSVRYCSAECQRSDWNSGHKRKCKDIGSINLTPTKSSGFGFRASPSGNSSTSKIALVPGQGQNKTNQKLREILFPYDEFVKYFNWDMPGLVPCGLINCGNSCFANVVLQCLSWTRPLVAYLLEKGHKRECRRNDWCFFCEFQTHVERASQSRLPFSPMNIISRLPNIGGNLGYGRQEDAHEFMRFVIDTMQSVCLDEFGGEKLVPPRCQETTLIQYIFGGHLQSQVMCTVCDNVSNQYENMMDLTVEIHGDAMSLRECLDQFTAKEWLHGDNMYKCDRCNDYVKAWKRLTIRRAPNILTIALKRFQGGRFGKLNKKISFPETLDLSPYSSGGGDSTDVYMLYAVIVHLDMLNASFFGHYICYIKDFRGNWYRIDDSEVENVELEDVLSQRAYMLLYSRVQARPDDEKRAERMESESSEQVSVESPTKGIGETMLPLCNGTISHAAEEFGCEKESPYGINPENTKELNASDSDSNPSIEIEDDLAREHQEDGNGEEEPPVKIIAVGSSSPPSRVEDTDTEMVDA